MCVCVCVCVKHLGAPLLMCSSISPTCLVRQTWRPSRWQEPLRVAALRRCNAALIETSIPPCQYTTATLHLYLQTSLFHIETHRRNSFRPIPKRQRCNFPPPPTLWDSFWWFSKYPNFNKKLNCLFLTELRRSGKHAERKTEAFPISHLHIFFNELIKSWGSSRGCWSLIWCYRKSQRRTERN